jgi:serine/threonine protein kinase
VPRPLAADFSQLELLKPIGEGSFGLVHMARFFQTTVAVKMLTMDAKRGAAGTASRPTPPSPAVLDALQKEASIMASLRHPNVVQYIGACLDPPCLIMEHCPRKSLDCLLAAGAANPGGGAAKSLPWTRLVSMALDSAKGVLYLHSRSPPIIHRDLKSPNLLVDALWHVKVSDFNLSRAIEPGSIVSSFQANNPRWLAPEVLRGAQATAASDVFSLGVVLWELMAWELPWEAINNSFQIIAAVTGGQRPAAPAADALPAGPLLCYDEYVGLMQDCWRRDPQARPSVDEVARRLRAMLTQLMQAAGRAAAPVPAAAPPAVGGDPQV